MTDKAIEETADIVILDAILHLPLPGADLRMAAMQVRLALAQRGLLAAYTAATLPEDVAGQPVVWWYYSPGYFDPQNGGEPPYTDFSSEEKPGYEPLYPASALTALSARLAEAEQGREPWTRDDLAIGLAMIDGITLHEVKSTVGDPADANNWREYLGRADDLLAHLSVAYADRDYASDYIDQLNVLCEDFGCEPGTDRLGWLHRQLTAYDRLRKESSDQFYRLAGHRP